MSAIFNSESKPFSVEYIFKKTSDEKALTLFESIAHSKGDRYYLLKANLTRKQYYVRISGLIDAGLIKRYKGKYSLTLFGRVVYGSLMIISNALDQHPKSVAKMTKTSRKEIDKLVTKTVF